MKILQFCKKSPIPPKDGESIAIHQLSKAFVNDGIDLTIFSILTPKHDRKKSKQYLKKANYLFEKIDTSVSYLGLIFNLFFSKNPYNTQRFYHKKIKKKLIDILKNNDFDIIQLEGVFLGVYLDQIKKHTKAKIVLRAHNVEHQIWKRLSKKESWLKALYLKKVLVPRLIKFENHIAQEVDVLVPISSIDNNYFQQHTNQKNIKTLPFAYETNNKIFELPKTFNVGFIGGLDWKPNSEGVNWFLSKVWDHFVIKSNSSCFNLAGRNFPKSYYDLNNSNVFIYGEVENAQEFTRQNSVMIAPIHSGSGMRIKIIEAMALGRTVISTTVGAEGIEYQNNKNIFIADSPEEWIKVLLELSSNKEKLESTAIAAQNLIATNHNSSLIGKSLIDYYKAELN